MDDRLKWLTPPALVLVSASPSYAVSYLSVEQAQKVCFPNADLFTPNNIIFTTAQVKAIEAGSGQKVFSRGQQVWRAVSGVRLQGYFVLDYVIGKHLAIDYAVALSPEGTVKQIEILNYRESYGGEVRNPDWRKQFVGKTPRSHFALNDGITNISGATLSSRHIIEGVRRILATYDVCLK